MAGHHPCLLMVTAFVLMTALIVDCQRPVYTICEHPPLSKINVTTGPFTIRSPNYPNDYTHNASCSLLIEGSGRKLVVELNFSSFNLEHSKSCDYDYLCIGSTNYCGTWVNGRTFQFILNEFDSQAIIYETDHSESASGFSIDVSSHLYTVGDNFFMPNGQGDSEENLCFLRVNNRFEFGGIIPCRWKSSLPIEDDEVVED